MSQSNREIAEARRALLIVRGYVPPHATKDLAAFDKALAFFEAALTAKDEERQAEVEKARRDENEAIQRYLRYLAGVYAEGTDGRNTFVLAADWVQSRLSPVQQEAAAPAKEKEGT